MNEKDKQEKKDNFMEWVTFIEDRVEKWKRNIPKSLSQELNWKVESLDKLENYILNKFTKEKIISTENKEELDAMASYIGETFRANLPNAHWFIELDDERNIFFNKPTIVTLTGAAISSFNFSTKNIKRQYGKFLMKIYTGKSNPSVTAK